MSSVQFNSVTPPAFMLPQPASTSKSILRRSRQEFLPEAQSDYAYGGNSIINFLFASGSDVASLPESYFRFDLYRKNAGVNDTQALAEGGVHALVKHISFYQANSGILLQRIEHYNRWYALQSNLHQRREDVDVMSRGAMDSVHDAPYSSEQFSGMWEPVYVGGGSTSIVITSGAGVATTLNADLWGITAAVVTGTLLTAAGPSQFIEVGDFVSFENRGTPVAASALIPANNFIARVTYVTNDSFGIDVDVPNNEGAALTTLVWNVSVLSRNEKRNARNAAVRRADTGANTYPTVCEFKPLASIWEHYLPLMVMKGGIRIQIELEDPNVAMRYVWSYASATVAFDYVIKNPRLMAVMITPHPDIVDQYLADWRSEAGLIFNLPSVKTMRITKAPTTVNEDIQIHPGLRSVREVYVTVSDSNMAEGTDALTRVSNSISTYLQSHITQYQSKVGSHDFPVRPIICDRNSSEAYEQLRHVAQSNDFRFTHRDWAQYNTLTTSATTHRAMESTKFIMAIDTSRDNGPNSTLTGADMSTVPYEFSVKRSAAYNTAAKADDKATAVGDALSGNPIYFFFFKHDALLQISSQATIVRN